MEVDPTKPLKAGDILHGRHWKVKYEGLHDLCFQCGRYGRRSSNCPLMCVQAPGEEQGNPLKYNKEFVKAASNHAREDPKDDPNATFGP